MDKGKAVAKDCSEGDAPAIGSRLESLPAEILELIAFHCADNLPLTYSTASTSESDSISATPPFHLRHLLLSSQRLYSFLNASSNPRLYAKIFRSRFDVDAISRRFGPSAVSAINLTRELKKRCTILKRIRTAVTLGRLYPEGLSQSSRVEMEENLWLCFMMMTENDGQNILQLKWARIEAYLSLHHSQDMLESAFKPEYPINSPDRALALHLNYLLSNPDTLASESQDESDEKLFVLRPFVFAAHRFDPFYAPWIARKLPMLGEQAKVQLAEMDQNPFFSDRRVRNESRTIEHCGQQITICSPNATQAACFLFFMKVEKDPAVTGLTEMGDMMDLQETMLGRRREREETGDGFTSRKALSLQSTDHDRDMKRLSSCLFPYQSPGLKPFFHLGQFEGSWEGRFTYFDFDSYRDMLGGKLRSLYEGPFGEQPQVWKIKEHIVKLKSDESPGGKGSALNAGYYPENDEPTDYKSMSVEEAKTMLQKRLSNGNTKYKEDDNKSLEEIIAETHLYPTFEAEEDQRKGAIDDEEDRYEILLSGTGHSAWGRFILRGRIRSWDGMLVMTKEYRPDGRGRWLYRGYVVAGGRLVGRWRDTFTPEDMSGYEGCFLLHRRGE